MRRSWVLPPPQSLPPLLSARACHSPGQCWAAPQPRHISPPAPRSYTYLNLDDGWSERKRGPDGRLVPNAAKFPSGIKLLADYVHSKGLKFGIYGDAGALTCAGYAGMVGAGWASGAAAGSTQLHGLTPKLHRLPPSQAPAATRRLTRRRGPSGVRGQPAEPGQGTRVACLLASRMRPHTPPTHLPPLLLHPRRRLPQVRQLLRPRHRLGHRPLHCHARRAQRHGPPHPLLPLRVGRRRPVDLGARGAGWRGWLGRVSLPASGPPDRGRLVGAQRRRPRRP